MENTIQEQINSNARSLEMVQSLITKEISRHVQLIGYCDQDAIEKLEDIPNWSSNKDRLVEIYNLAKCKQTMGCNHSAMVRELKREAEEESDSE